jgi:hypothetical protein
MARSRDAGGEFGRRKVGIQNGRARNPGNEEEEAVDEAVKSRRVAIGSIHHRAVFADPSEEGQMWASGSLRISSRTEASGRKAAIAARNILCVCEAPVHLDMQPRRRSGDALICCRKDIIVVRKSRVSGFAQAIGSDLRGFPAPLSCQTHLLTNPFLLVGGYLDGSKLMTGETSKCAEHTVDMMRVIAKSAQSSVSQRSWEN